MRRVIFETSISMDGFIEGPEGELDWMVPSDEDEPEEETGSLFAVFDTIFFGRKTYETIAQVSQHGMSSDNEKEFFYLMHGMRKYVFSRSVRHVQGNAMVISGNIEEEVLRIRGEEGKDIWFRGGANLLQSFMALDLVDEYVLSVHPVLLNSGKPLFSGNNRPTSLTLVKKQKLKSGVVLLRYKPESRLNVKTYEGRSL